MYSKKYVVTSYEVNNKLTLKLNCLFQWFSEIAWEHAKELNVGFEEMETSNIYWVLIGVKTKINKFPKWQDKLTLRTAPTGIKGLYFDREFILNDEKDNVLVEADSKWLIIDRNTLKPLKSVEDDYKYLQIKDNTVLDFEFTRLHRKTGLTNTCNEIAKYTDVDMHQHINNAIYVRWVENILGLYSNNINSFSIQFLKEVKQNDNVIINYSDKIDNKIFFEAIIDNTDVHCFRADVKLTNN